MRVDDFDFDLPEQLIVLRPAGGDYFALAVGSVEPAQTLRSLLLFVLYAAVYYLVVHHVRTRRQVTRLVRALLGR